MKKTIKIQIHKNDELPVIAESVFTADGSEVVLVVPRNSKLAESRDNFSFLKKGLGGKKHLVIESVDEEVLAMAKQAGIDADNPFFVRMGAEHASRDTVKKNSVEVPVKDYSHDNEISLDGDAVSDDNDSLEGEDKEDLDVEDVPLEDLDSSEEEEVISEDSDSLDRGLSYDELDIKPKRRSGALVKVGAGVILTSLVFVAFYILPEANIEIKTKKLSFNYDDKVTIDKNLETLNLKTMSIPGEILSYKRNAELAFPATDKKTIATKARGKIMIYNAYSSSPQILVSGTRFQSADGKIFRLEEKVTVPGAKIVDGKVLASSIEAKIVADKAGVDYNILAKGKLTIPGFAKTPKFAAFYGEMKTALAGGFVGQKPTPTANDIKKAREKALADVRANLEMMAKSELAKGFKLLEDASQFKVIKERVSEDVDESGQFSMFIDAELTAVAFQETDLRGLMKEKLKQDLGATYDVKSDDLKYDLASLALEKGRVGLEMDYKAVVEQPVDSNKLADTLKGKPSKELWAAVKALPGLDKANVSLWPFWVMSAPSSEDKIKVVVD
jgi:hypothetical protein